MRKNLSFKSGYWAKLEFLAAGLQMKPLEYLYHLIDDSYYRKKFGATDRNTEPLKAEPDKELSTFFED
jgi:hypothetical protein